MRSPATTTMAPVSYDSAPGRLQAIVEMREVWRYRYLIRNLVSRDLKVRYKRSVLGFVWVMLNPLLTTVVLSVVFSFLFGRSQPNYPVFVLGGILVWNVFSQGTVAAMSNLIGNAQTLRRMYIPPSVFVISSVGSALVNLLFTLVPFILVAFLFRVVFNAPFALTWLYVPVACLQAVIFTLGVGLIVASVMVFFNDTYEIYLVLLTAYNYLTPVFYPISILPPFMRPWEVYNPMYLFISGVQKAVVGASSVVHGHLVSVPPSIPDLQTQLISWGMALVALLIGWLLFTRLEGRFAYHF